MCELETKKLLEHGNALTKEQKSIIIQTFPTKTILEELLRRDTLKDAKIAGCEQSLQL